MLAAVLACLFLSTVAHGRSVGGPKVTSLPEGNLQIQQCSETDGPDCAVRNAQFKSFVVCAPNNDDISSYTYQLTVPTDTQGSTTRLSHNAGAAPQFNTDAEKYGAVASTLMTPNSRCREILIRFWSVPGGSESTTVVFAVKKVANFIFYEIYRTSFSVSQALDVTAAPTAASTTMRAPEATEEPATASTASSSASLVFQMNGNGESGPSEAWQCSCLPR